MAAVEDEQPWHSGGGGWRRGGWSGLEERLARDAAVAMASEERLHI